MVKKHELTREDKEQDRIRHVDVCDANTGPIYLACKYPQELLDLMNQWKESYEPVYDFVADDEIGHRVWVIDREKEKQIIADRFANISAVHIADGHHRAASAVKVGLKRRQEHPDYKGDEEFDLLPFRCIPDDQLTILAYNRVVHDLNGMDEHAYIASLKFNFELMPMPGFPCKPVGETWHWYVYRWSVVPSGSPGRYLQRQRCGRTTGCFYPSGQGALSDSWHR